MTARSPARDEAFAAFYRAELDQHRGPGVRVVEPATGAIAELATLAGAGGFTTDQVFPWHRRS